MKKTLPILLAIAIVSLASNCNRKEPLCCEYPIGILDLNFKATYANKPLVINKIYDYEGKKIRFTRFQFFLTSDINYFGDAKPTGQLSRVPIANLVNFTDANDSLKAANGITLKLNMGSGNYTSMNFDLGVSKTLNAKLPKDFTPAEPMSDGGNYWTDWKSFIFVKLEGLMDKDGDGRFETGITLHTGGDEALATMKFDKNYTIQELKTTNVNFELNVNELVKGIDLATVSSTHQVGASPIMKIMMGNFTTALTLK